MVERFPRASKRAVVEAERAARERGDSHIGTEHLFIGAVTVGTDAAQSYGWTGARVSGALADMERRDLASIGVIADVGDHLPPLRRRRHLPFTDGAKESLKRSLAIASSRGDRWICPDHILAALAERRPFDPAVRLMIHLDVDPSEVARRAMRL
jgi:ATP-dependent Clp protease ATP-binding subunit ClpA